MATTMNESPQKEIRLKFD